MNKFLLLTTLLLITFKSQSQDYFKPIDSIIRLYEGKNVPGFIVRVTKNGKTVYSNRAGYANLEKKEKINDKSVFALASTSKQFTAAGIVLLQKQGKLSFNDNLRKYIPEFPAYAEKITINQLLNHTGGLKDYRALAMLRGEDSDNYNAAAIKDLLTAQELNDVPGANWKYSNSGYWCLAQIIEKVSGQSVAAFADKNIFRPLKMKNTRYVTKPNNKLKNRATGYKNDGSGFTISEVDEYSIGGAGVYSTAADLEKWMNEMESHRVFGDAFWNTMITENPAKGKGFTYTKGLFNFKYSGHTMINHGGDVVGFHPITAYFPDDKITVVILSNDNNFKRYDILGAATDLLLGEKYDYPKAEANVATKEVAVPETITVDPALLESYTGNYELAPGYVIAITTEEGKLKFNQLWDGVNLFFPPTKEAHHFAIDGAQISFIDFAAGKAANLRVVTDNEDSMYKRLYKDPDLTLYDKYTGEFFSKSLNSKITFFTEHGILRYRLGNNTNSDVANPPESEGVFSTGHGEVIFTKNETGAITGFTLNHERALNMEFVKQKSE